MAWGVEIINLSDGSCEELLLLSIGYYILPSGAAIRLYEQILEKKKALLGSDHPDLTEAIERLVQLYEATQQVEKARAWRAKLPPEKAPARNK